MKPSRLIRPFFAVCSGMMLLQIGGCTSTEFFDLLQTVFLGVTAAGTFVIFQNV